MGQINPWLSIIYSVGVNNMWDKAKKEIKRLNYYFHFYSMPKTGAFTGSEFTINDYISFFDRSRSTVQTCQPDRKRVFDEP